MKFEEILLHCSMINCTNFILYGDKIIIIGKTNPGMECVGTVCPGSSDQFYVVTYYIKRVTTSWTYSMILLLSVYSLLDKVLVAPCILGPLAPAPTSISITLIITLLPIINRRF